MRLTEQEILTIIKGWAVTHYPQIRMDDIAVHLRIGNDSVEADVEWEDNIKRDEQTFEVPYGC
jgi:hypothetical protein